MTISTFGFRALTVTLAAALVIGCGGANVTNTVPHDAVTPQVHRTHPDICPNTNRADIKAAGGSFRIAEGCYGSGRLSYPGNTFAKGSYVQLTSYNKWASSLPIPPGTTALFYVRAYFPVSGSFTGVSHGRSFIKGSFKHWGPNACPKEAYGMVGYALDASPALIYGPKAQIAKIGSAVVVAIAPSPFSDVTIHAGPGDGYLYILYCT